MYFNACVTCIHGRIKVRSLRNTKDNVAELTKIYKTVTGF